MNSRQTNSEVFERDYLLNHAMLFTLMLRDEVKRKKHEKERE
jgi:hypothetical protein